MRIEAVVICVDYADFLEQTAPINRVHFDDYIVVTTHADRRTRDVCRKHAIRCVCTEEFYVEESTFNKARGINYGLIQMKYDEWRIHLDADIALPPHTRRYLENSRPIPENIYGADRVNVIGRAAWDKYKLSGDPQYSWDAFLAVPSDWALGARLLHFDYGGYVPIGFFQMWHASQKKLYPLHQGYVEHTDVLHSLQWTRENRVLLPEFICMHLVTKTLTQQGSNWSGRVTPEFSIDENPYLQLSRPPGINRNMKY